MTGGVVAHAAATVLLLRDATGGGGGIEVHLQRRRAEMDYGARAFVFPGGSVDPGDAADDARALVDIADLAARAARMELSGDEQLCAALHVCAVREVFEEAGILLCRAVSGLGGAPIAVAGPGAAPMAVAGLGAAPIAAARERVLGGSGFADELRALGLSPAVEDLAYVARFVTPLGFPRRFDTRFFAVRAPEGQTAAIHTGEADTGEWFAPRDLLTRNAAGGAVVMPPTLVMLAELARHRDVASVLADLGSRDVCGILFTQEMARAVPPDHLPTVAEVEAMGARATPDRLAGSP